LKLLAKENIDFGEGKYSFPLIQGDYKFSSKQLIQSISPVFNITEKEKAKFRASFIGKLFKQGHGVKTWKERLVYIIETKMIYFDINAAFKGEFHIEVCEVQNIDPEECHAPKNSFPFKLINKVDGVTNDMYCYVLTSELRDVFSLLVLCKTRDNCIKRDLARVPDTFSGWMVKQGEVFKTLKRRYFFLHSGILQYFPNEERKDELGHINLRKSIVKLLENNKFVIVPEEGEGRRILYLEAESNADKNKWCAAIEDHIQFCNSQF
jgi:hypothetical protein